MSPREPSTSEPKPTGAEEIWTLGGIWSDADGALPSRRDLALLLPGLCPGGSRVPRVGEEMGGHPAQHQKLTAHIFCWGCLRVLFRNAADDHLHQRAGRENFFFFLCMIGCFSVPAPGQFNLIGEKRKKKKKVIPLWLCCW